MLASRTGRRSNPVANPLPVLQERLQVSCGRCHRPRLRWIRLQQHMQPTMEKHLLGAVWGLPASFALPSVAACRRALALIRPRLVQLHAVDAARRCPQLALRGRP